MFRLFLGVGDTSSCDGERCFALRQIWTATAIQFVCSRITFTANTEVIYIPRLVKIIYIAVIRSFHLASVIMIFNPKQTATSVTVLLKYSTTRQVLLSQWLKGLWNILARYSTSDVLEYIGSSALFKIALQSVEENLISFSLAAAEA